MDTIFSIFRRILGCLRRVRNPPIQMQRAPIGDYTTFSAHCRLYKILVNKEQCDLPNAIVHFEKDREEPWTYQIIISNDSKLDPNNGRTEYKFPITSNMNLRSTYYNYGTEERTEFEWDLQKNIKIKVEFSTPTINESLAAAVDFKTYICQLIYQTINKRSVIQAIRPSDYLRYCHENKDVIEYQNEAGGMYPKFNDDKPKRNEYIPQGPQRGLERPMKAQPKEKPLIPKLAHAKIPSPGSGLYEPAKRLMANDWAILFAEGVTLVTMTAAGEITLVDDRVIAVIRRGGSYTSSFMLYNVKSTPIFSKFITEKLSFGYDNDGLYFQWTDVVDKMELTLNAIKFTSRHAMNQFKYFYSRCRWENDNKKKFESLSKKEEEAWNAKMKGEYDDEDSVMDFDDKSTASNRRPEDNHPTPW